MSKYIIDTNKYYLHEFDGALIVMMHEGKPVSVYESKDNLEELNSDYINEHYGELQDEAYQRGLEDAWEAARKIAEMADPPYWEVFGEYKSDLFKKITAAEAIEKLKAYEDKQTDRIEVGDCVYDKEEQPRDDGVVTWVGKDTAYVMWRDGSSGERMKESLCKTGRTLNVEAILEAMRT